MKHGKDSARRVRNITATMWFVAAGGLLLAARVASAQTSAAPASGFTLAQSPVHLAEQQPPPDEGLMQTQMRERGWGGSFLEQYGIKLNGYAEAGFNYNWQRPTGNDNGIGHVFTDSSDDPTLNQISLSVTRDALVSPSNFDMGFKVQVIYGSDARFTQANGTNFYGSSYASQRGFSFFNNNQGQRTNFISNTIFPGQFRPDEQIDVLQAYVTFNVPVGNGMIVTAGKFVTPWGVEKIDPTQNGLYSHSYIFSISQPYTLTGVTGRDQIDEQWGVMGGVVVGWDQSLQDNNDFPSFVAQVTYKYDKDLSFVLSGIFGPEEMDNRSDWRSLVDLTVDYQVTPDTHVGAEGVVGYEPDVGTTFLRPSAQQGKFFAFTGDKAFWDAVAGYVDYRLDDAGMYMTHLRGEFFNDPDGARLVATRIYSLTGGVSITPFITNDIGKNLVIRPEIRYDYSDRKLFDGQTNHAQLIFAVDVIFKF